MAQFNSYQPNPELDLMFERVIDVPRELVWAAWTTPEQLKKWFTPAPWKTVDCEIDLRPGGIFSTMMRSPEGQEFPNLGCYLEVIKNERLVWTNALEPNFRPSKHPVETPGHECAEFSFTHPRFLILSDLSLTIGTSPFQPLSPPVKLYFTLFRFSSFDTISAISLTDM